jgi:hypothetical protein
MDHVAHGSDLVGAQSIAVEGEDHLVGWAALHKRQRPPQPPASGPSRRGRLR